MPQEIGSRHQIAFAHQLSRYTMVKGMGSNHRAFDRRDARTGGNLADNPVDSRAGEGTTIADQEWSADWSSALVSHPIIEILLEQTTDSCGQGHAPPLVTLAHNLDPSAAQPDLQVLHLDRSYLTCTHTRKCQDLEDQCITEIASVVCRIVQFGHNRWGKRFWWPWLFRE